MKASILIVGDDPVLLHTRAELLRDWQIVTANSREAEEAILARTYDLLIFSKTAQEKVVRGLIDLDRPGSAAASWIQDAGDSLRGRVASGITDLPGGAEQPGRVAVRSRQDTGLLPKAR